MRPLKMAKQLIEIYQDINRRLPCSDYQIHSFDQIWGSTALGFGGVGGSMMTTETTYVLIPDTIQDRAFVYFGGRFAYVAVVNDRFIEDLEKHDMKSVIIASQRYT